MAPEKVQRIVDTAVQLLEQTGLSVRNDALAKRLSQAGFEVRGQHVLVPAAVSCGFLERWRQRVRDEDAPQADRFDGWRQPLTGYFNEYCANLLPAAEKKPVPFTVDRLIQATDTAAHLCRLYGQTPGVVGQPGDVPGELQSLTRCLVGMLCTPGPYPMEPCSMLSAAYLFRLADLCGQRIRKLNVYMATPLYFGGESVDIALAFAGRIERIKVTSMPALGCNAPLDLESALCLGLAESMGGAAVMETLTGLTCDFLVQLHPFDFWAVNFVYGTPETQLLSEAAVDFNAALRGVKSERRRANIHVMAKTPGVQAAAEKSAMITAGVRGGAVSFSGIGTLSLDEIYSPVQAALDMEMLEQAGRLRGGWPCDEPQDAADMLRRIREGLDAGYMNTDLTLDCLADCVWHSRLFTRYTLAEYHRRDEREAVEKAADMVRQYERCAPLYRPERAMLREMKQICESAWRQATGEAWYPPQMNG